MYRNEAEAGRAVRDSGLTRDAVFITTKLPAENSPSDLRSRMCRVMA
jgi:diketogulonate reductase-like aldo/keto reductase